MKFNSKLQRSKINNRRCRKISILLGTTSHDRWIEVIWWFRESQNKQQRPHPASRTELLTQWYFARDVYESVLSYSRRLCRPSECDKGKSTSVSCPELPMQPSQRYHSSRDERNGNLGSWNQPSVKKARISSRGSHSWEWYACVSPFNWEKASSDIGFREKPERFRGTHTTGSI